MLSDDTFQTRLDTTIAALRYWLPTINDVANISESEGGGIWKIMVTPKVPGGCPFELLLRSDQHYDLTISGQAYEDLPLQDFDLFLKILKAISNGDVIERQFASAATGKPTGLATLIRLPENETWEQGQQLETDPATGVQYSDSTVFTDRSFLPYRR